MKNYLRYIVESVVDKFKFEDTDWILYLYQNFFKILKIHEEHYHNDTKIVNDPDFKKEVNDMFGRFQNGWNFNARLDLPIETAKKYRDNFVTCDNLYILIEKYEKKLYGDVKMVVRDRDTSLYDMIMFMFEELDEGETNKYLDEFSVDDIYVEEISVEENEISKEDAEDSLEQFTIIRNATDGFIRKSYEDFVDDETQVTKLLNLYKDIKDDPKYQQPRQQEYIDEHIEELEEELEMLIKNKPMREAAIKKVEKLVKEYEEKFAGNELSFLMNIKKKLEEELDKDNDDFYLGALEDILDTVEEKLEDKGIK